MTMLMETPDVDGLGEVVTVLREWQREGAPLQLHPGDLGWFWRFGAEATAGGVRTWRVDGELVAIGLLDGADLLRLGIAPDAQQDEALAAQVVADVVDPARGVLPGGEVFLESPPGALVHDLLGEAGWAADEPWALLRRDLAAPVEDPGVRVDVVGAADAAAWSAVNRSAFDSPTAADDRWHALAAGLPFGDARSLLARNAEGAAVASIIVWSAGPGRPGLIEPMGVHQDHRGHGYGTAITLAGAATLRELGSSSVLVATPSAKVGAVATYRSAGLERLPERRDRRRDA